MTEAKAKPWVRRGRIFPEIQWTEEKKAQWRSQHEAVRQRCRPVFDRLQPELMATHYNWYLAVEPETLEYVIDRDERIAVNKVRDKYPGVIPFVFRINETGACGSI